MIDGFRVKDGDDDEAPVTVTVEEVPNKAHDLAIAEKTEEIATLERMLRAKTEEIGVLIIKAADANTELDQLRTLTQQQAEQLRGMQVGLLEMEMRAIQAEGGLTHLQNQLCQDRAHAVAIKLKELRGEVHSAAVE